MKTPMDWVCVHGCTFKVGEGGNIPEMANCSDYHEPLPSVDVSDEDKIMLMKCGRAFSKPPQKRKGISDEFFIKEYDDMTRKGSNYNLSLEEFRWHEKVYRKFHENKPKERMINEHINY